MLETPRPRRCDFPAFGFSTLDELAIDIADDLDFLGGAGGEDDAVGLQALVLAARQLGFPLAILADQDAAQPKSCGAALAIAQLDQAAPYQSGPGKDLDRQLAAGRGRAGSAGRVGGYVHAERLRRHQGASAGMHGPKFGRLEFRVALLDNKSQSAYDFRNGEQTSVESKAGVNWSGGIDIALYIIGARHGSVSARAYAGISG